MSDALKTWLSARAFELGFRGVGIADPRALDRRHDLANYIAAGYHGEMKWLAERQEWRARPSALWPEARSIIMLAEPYRAPSGRAPKDHGEISAYARGHDYHDVIKKRLKALGRDLIAHAGGEIKVFVDTAPVMEKPLAALAGLGWVGRHGNLLARDLGNWFFLGALFTTHELPADSPARNHCGSCRACLDACPTRAFDADGHLDARRCISYLTIEYDGIIADELARNMGNLIYGCDICLDACPWNKFGDNPVDHRLAHRAENNAPKLEELLMLDDAGFRARFPASPIKRIGWVRMMRNALIAAGNSGNRNFLPLIARFINHENAVLSATANWAKLRLCSAH